MDLWEEKRQRLKHEIKILEHLHEKLKEKGCCVMEVGRKLSEFKQELKDLAVRQHHQA